jgi:hypothetical protein
LATLDKIIVYRCSLLIVRDKQRHDFLNVNVFEKSNQ